MSTFFEYSRCLKTRATNSAMLQIAAPGICTREYLCNCFGLVRLRLQCKHLYLPCSSKIR